jgi:glycosyltransferase involved in cell wall biosynthesis
VKGIHHFVPVFHRGDAVGRHTLRLRDASRAQGYESDIFVATVDPETRTETLPALEYADRARSDDIVVYQFATASPMAPWLAGRAETLVVNYHNITPPELLAPWDNHLALGQLRAQGELQTLAPRAALAVADSAYNESHLRAAGFARTAVVPPSAGLSVDTLEATRPHRPGSGARWLCVGRIAPNKAIEDIVAALAVTRLRRDPEATLLIIGKPATEAYAHALHRYVDELGLSDAVQFGGHASDESVAAAYGASDVLVVTSAHEGFCVPVVEAMAARLPVVAFAQGALPEVLGRAGTFVAERDPTLLAATISELLADSPRREALQEAAADQLSQLDMAGAAVRLIDLLGELTGAGSG